MNIRRRLVANSTTGGLRGEYKLGHYIDIPLVTVTSCDMVLATEKQNQIIGTVVKPPTGYEQASLDFAVFKTLPPKAQFALHNKFASQVCWLPVETNASRSDGKTWPEIFASFLTGLLRDADSKPLGLIHIFKGQYHPKFAMQNDGFLKPVSGDWQVRIEYASILAEHQNRGLGKFLMQTAIQEIDKYWPNAVIVLDTSATDINAAGQLAQSFHSKIGFVVKETMPYTKPNGRLWYARQQPMIDTAFQRNLKYLTLSRDSKIDIP